MVDGKERSATRLLILSRDALLGALDGAESGNGGAVLRRLAHLTRRGCHLLLIASEPDQWFPTRSSGDNVLTAQARLRERILEFGGDLDGTYYVARSLFSDDRNRIGALRDILERYHCEPGDALLLSRSAALLRTAAALGLETVEAPADPCGDALERLVEAIA